MLKSLKSKLWGGKSISQQRAGGEQLSDAILIQIYQKALNGNSKEKVLVAEGSGSWLESIKFDGEVYWTVEDDRPSWLMVNDEAQVPVHLRDLLLPSDSQYRPDMKPLREKNFVVAEKEKFALEELQRKDKKNRQMREKERASTKQQ